MAQQGRCHATDGAALTTPIPALFTRRGFWSSFLPAVVPEMRAAIAQHAALRPGVPGPDETAQARLVGEMLELYYADTIDRWQRVESGLGLRMPESLGEAGAVLRPLALPPSPVTRLLQAMADETRLTERPAPPADAGAAGEARAQAQAVAGTVIEQVLTRLESEGYGDLRSRIVAEKMITPDDWRADHFLARGSNFGLAQNFWQIGPFRPRVTDPDVPGLFWCGASIQPGTGVPTVMLSARFAVDAVLAQLGQKRSAA